MRENSKKAHGKLRGIALSGVAVLGAGFCSGALAQTGSITFVGAGAASSSTEAIPTLSTWATIILAVLTGAAAVYALRRRSGLLSILAAAIGVGTVLAGIGTPTTGIAQSNPSLFSITDPNGETLTVFTGVTNEYTNNTGIDLVVDSATMPQFCLPGVGIGGDSCDIGTNLADGATCAVYCGGGNASDRRLKTDIQLVGRTHNGLPLYHFRYIDKAQVYEGVMAQDVLEHYPEAVITRADGYMAVNYQMLGLEMKAMGHTP